MQEREKKLPVWAQVLIQGLRHDIETLEEQVAYHNMRTEPTSVYWERYETGRYGRKPVRLYIPDKMGRLFIDLGKNRHGQEERLEVSQDTGRDGTRGIQVRCAFSSIRILPEVSNSVYITALDPRDTTKD